MSPASHFSLLVVDDEPDLRTLYELTLLREGYEIETAACVEDAWAQLADRTFSAVITDMRLPDGSGLDLLHRLEEAGRREKTIVITAYGSAESAVEALKAGAYDYLTKPVDLKLFRSVVASALGRAAASGPTVQPDQLPSESGAARPSRAGVAARPVPTIVIGPAAAVVPPAGALARMAGNSAPMQQVRSLIEKVSRSMAPVLVHGESGTGKELVARAIHDSGVRRSQPFIAVNCGAIPEQLLEAEFFGYRRGAFTGANEDRDGFFQAARGGTLFLDEIGDMPPEAQTRLLRVLQEGEYMTVGGRTPIKANVRIVAATHRDLRRLIQQGLFREDLFYRLNVVPIRLPPLRERLDDIPELANHYLQMATADGLPTKVLSPEAMARLKQHRWPGNVRELVNLVRRLSALYSEEIIGVETIESELADAVSAIDHGPSSSEAGEDISLADAVDRHLQSLFEAHGDRLPPDGMYDRVISEVERPLLALALGATRGNQLRAARLLGLNRNTLRKKIKDLDVPVVRTPQVRRGG